LGVEIGLLFFQMTMSSDEIEKVISDTNSLTNLLDSQWVGLFSLVLKQAETRYSIIEMEFLAKVDSLVIFKNRLCILRLPKTTFKNYTKLQILTSFKATRYKIYNSIESMSECNSLIPCKNADRNEHAETLS
jgi:hypothetical protein